VGGLGDEGPDRIRYRVSEEGEHGVGVPPMPCRERTLSSGLITDGCPARPVSVPLMRGRIVRFGASGYMGEFGAEVHADIFGPTWNA
jgi:hypothetical protein